MQITGTLRIKGEHFSPDEAELITKLKLANKKYGSAEWNLPGSDPLVHRSMALYAIERNLEAFKKAGATNIILELDALWDSDKNPHSRHPYFDMNSDLLKQISDLGIDVSLSVRHKENWQSKVLVLAVVVLAGIFIWMQDQKLDSMIERYKISKQSVSSVTKDFETCKEQLGAWGHEYQE